MERSVIDSVGQKVDPAHLAKPAVAGIIVLVLMVAVVAGRSLIETATASDFSIERSTDSNAAIEVDSESAEEPNIYVHVTGCVMNPGLVELATGSRIADAVTAAGGFSDDARPDSVNLARQVQDGEQVVVLSNDQTIDAGQATTVAEVQAYQGPVSGKVNINTATAEELQGLPGVGPATAEKIVSDRNANGPFQNVDDLKRVSGIGDKKFDQLSDMICI